MKFVEQFPCSTCQYSGYDVTEFGTRLATTVLFLHAGHACGAIMKLKNNYGENINLHLKQAAMKAGFCGIDYKGLMSAEKQVTEAAKTGRKRRQVVQAGISTS